jgi:AcrR family transcriptional regulator
MTSGTSNVSRRVPRQGRGERRVTQLITAAEEVIARNGYEAATMTEIAECAGASIGAVYQYFPNKEAIVRALRAQYGNEMEARWTLLEESSKELSIKQMVDQLIDIMVQFMEEHPAYIPLLDAPVSYKRDQQARNRLRERFARLFHAIKPSLDLNEAFQIANVSLQIVKSLNPLYADAKPKEREELVLEFKFALTAYLESRLTS